MGFWFRLVADDLPWLSIIQNSPDFIGHTERSSHRWLRNVLANQRTLCSLSRLFACLEGRHMVAGFTCASKQCRRLRGHCNRAGVKKRDRMAFQRLSLRSCTNSSLNGPWNLRLFTIPIIQPLQWSDLYSWYHNPIDRISLHEKLLYALTIQASIWTVF